MVQTKGNFSSILRQTYDLELSTLAEYKMEFFFPTKCGEHQTSYE